ncbi:hypothetical protein [Deinococcus sp. QL22]|uniref:hypothetical protein n=1 Tax=Deinococcus sp. QL22 TaxID=2939437 RepID=UPI0020179416|nr:hypothetical protein [Deinococcus sp. QL22]UQN08124.1 hypothetical protein M1R55_18735 [Deinococcus sp. QL22]
MSLPVDPHELEQVRAERQRKARRAEQHLAVLLAAGSLSRSQQQAVIEVTELNSKLRYLRTHLAAELGLSP